MAGDHPLFPVFLLVQRLAYTSVRPLKRSMNNWIFASGGEATVTVWVESWVWRGGWGFGWAAAGGLWSGCGAGDCAVGGCGVAGACATLCGCPARRAASSCLISASSASSANMRCSSWLNLSSDTVLILARWAWGGFSTRIKARA